MSTIQKVELVRPQYKNTLSRAWFNLFCGLAFRTLIVWWAVASFFPELGLTYWGLILPVAAVRMLTGNSSSLGRLIPKGRLSTFRWNHGEDKQQWELTEVEPIKK